MSDRPRGLLETAVARPVTVAVGVILVVLFGGLSLVGLPIQLAPDISKPKIDISTRWPGAAPTEVETEILEEQEQVLKGLPGLVEMTSQASPDRGRLTLEFEVGTDIDDAPVRVTNRLSEVSSYPEAADRPVVSTSDLTGPPLAVITMRDLEGEPVGPYRTWVAEEVIPSLERVPGVAGMIHIGGQDSEIHVSFDPRALAERGLRLGELAERVRAELRDVSAGEMSLGKRRYLVRTPLVPEEIEDLEHMVLGTDAEGTPIRLGDVAEVRPGLRRPRGVAFSDQTPSMILLLTREAGTNVLEVTRAVREAVSELDEELFAPEGMTMEVISDQVGYITGALDLVRQNLLLGATLAVLSLFFFLRSFGASAIISLSIPVCVFGTALGMSLMGRTINVVSLAGITFAVGMVLDNSIVVLEAIDTFRSKVATAAEAALAGVREVWGAVLASTLTTIAVFAPIVAWEGEVGQLLRDVAVAITMAVATSLLVSVAVIPSLAAKLLRPRKRVEPGRLERAGDRFRERIVAGARYLGARSHRAALTVFLVVGASGAAAWYLTPPLEYLPTGNRNLIFGILIPPPGYSTEEFDAMGRSMQARIAEHIGVEKDGVPAIRRSFFVGDGSIVYAGAVAEDPERVREILPFMRRVQSSVPGTFGFTNQSSLFGSAVGGGRSIDIDIVGSDIPTLTAVGGRMMGAIRQTLPEAQVRPRPSLDSGAPELQVRPRRREAADLGIRLDELGLLVDAFVDGAIVGEVSPADGYEVDVVVRAQRAGGDEIDDPGELMNAPIVAGENRTVPLSVVADVEETIGPTVIRRLERRRAITLQISPPESMPLETAVLKIREEVVEPLERSGEVPAGIRIDISGTAGDLDIAKRELRNVLILAVIICYLLLSALFEDFLSPIAVLASLPLAAAGGMMSLVAVDAAFGPVPLDLLTALGFLILIGVVVNNAILVVDGSMARLREGKPLDEAVPDAVRVRVRPIFMTTVTSLAGLLPMVVSPGAGSELYRGVGAIVLGGLALSSLLVVFVVPSLFVLLWRAREATRSFSGRSEAASGESPAE